MPAAVPIPLNRERLAAAVHSLAAIDQDLARISAINGVPPMWARKQGYSTLVQIILEQQVSLASADAMYRRLKKHVTPLTPKNILQAGAPFLQSLGITRQKSQYFINVAEAIRSKDLTLGELVFCDDKTAIDKLTGIKGIGPWTAQVYLLNALLRPDVWPAGDIALATAVKHLKKLEVRPKPDAMMDLAEIWSPYRATAARMLWQYYLSGVYNVAGIQRQ
jgi:DNA-3-methyladenine glycosylase II